MSGLFGRATVGNGAAPVAAGFKVQTSIYGLPIPLVYGTARVAGNLIHLQDPKQTAVKSQAQSSKLVKVDSQTTGYSYSAAIALALAEGPIASIGKVWRDKDTPLAWSAFAAAGWSLFLGSLTQSPWSYLTSAHPGEAVPYQSTAYVAHPTLDLPGNSLSNYGWEVGGLSIFGSFGIVDANPKDVLVDFLTDATHGLAISSALLGNLTAYSNYCVALGLFLSPVLNAQTPASDTIAAILEATNSAAVWYDGVLNFVPYGDTNATGNGVTFVANATPVYDLSDNDFLANPGTDPVVVERKRAAEAFNQFTVEFENRARDYNPDVQEAKDQASIEANGPRPAPALRFPAIKDAATARLVAQLRLQRELHIRNLYRFRLPARFALLTPMDLVTLTDAGLGFAKLPVRLVSIDELDDGALECVAEDWPVGAATASRYGAAASSGYAAATNAAPGAIATAFAFEAPGALAAAALEIWVGAKGAGAAWGGCEVHISTDNVRFTKVGALLGRSNFGTLRSALASAPASPPSDVAHTLQVDLASGGGGALASSSAAGLAALEALCFVDGEFIAYQTATLVGANQYDLTTLARGLYGSAIPASHAIGAGFVRCDSALARIAWPNGKNGDVVYLKFPSFNTYGGALEDISTVASYAHTIGRTFVTTSAPTAPTLALTNDSTDLDTTTTTITGTLYPGSSAPAALTYTLYRKIGAAAQTVLASGTGTDFPLSLLVRANPRATTGFKLVVVDPLFATPFVATLVVGPDTRDAARGSGNASARMDDDIRRGGDGGYATGGTRFGATPIYDASGATPLLDPVTRRLQTGLGMPGGTSVSTTERGGNKGDTALDSGNSILAAYVDFSRAFVGKHLGNVPDDGTSNRNAGTSNQITGGGRGYAALDASNIAIAAALDFSRAYTGKSLANVPDDGTSDRRAVNLNQQTGAGRGFAAIDSGNVVVAGGVDFSRSYTGKSLANVPDDGTSDRRAVNLNQQTGAGRGFLGFDSSSILVAGAADFSRSYVGKSLANIPDDGTTDRRAVNLNQQTGAGRGFAAIDSGNVVVAAGLDLSRSYTGKSLANIPDDGTTDRRAVTLNQQTGAGRGFIGLDSASKLVTGVTPAATAADGVAGIESGKGANTKASRQSGNGVARVGDDNARAGFGGIPTPASRFGAFPIYDATGATPIFDPVLKRFDNMKVGGTLDSPAGTLGVSIVAADSAGGPKSVARGAQDGTGYHTTPVTFALAYGSTPRVRIFGGASYEPRSKWGTASAADTDTGASAPSSGPQFDDFAALNLTPSGFTIQARLRQPGAPTARSNAMPGTALVNVGDTAAATLSFAPANDNTYAGGFAITVSAVADNVGQSCSASAVIALDTNDGTGWVERTSRTYSVSGVSSATQTWSAQSLAATVSGIGATGQARLRIKSLTGVPVGNATVSVTPGSFTYTTTSGDQYVSKTVGGSASAPPVVWEATGVV